MALAISGTAPNQTITISGAETFDNLATFLNANSSAGSVLVSTLSLTCNLSFSSGATLSRSTSTRNTIRVGSSSTNYRFTSVGTTNTTMGVIDFGNYGVLIFSGKGYIGSSQATIMCRLKATNLDFYCSFDSSNGSSVDVVYRSDNNRISFDIDEKLRVINNSSYTGVISLGITFDPTYTIGEIEWIRDSLAGTEIGSGPYNSNGSPIINPIAFPPTDDLQTYFWYARNGTAGTTWTWKKPKIGKGNNLKMKVAPYVALTTYLKSIDYSVAGGWNEQIEMVVTNNNTMYATYDVNVNNFDKAGAVVQIKDDTETQLTQTIASDGAFGTKSIIWQKGVSNTTTLLTKRTNTKVRIRRRDWIEYNKTWANYNVDYTEQSLPQTDSYYTNNETANLSQITFTTVGSNITAITINSAMTLDKAYDITKAYFDANMGIDNPFSTSGTVWNVASVIVNNLGNLTSGTKLKSITSTSTATSTNLPSNLIASFTTLTTTNFTNFSAFNFTGNITGNVATNQSISGTNSTITGTVSNTGAGIISVNLANATLTTGTNVVAQYPITITDSNNSPFSIRVYVYDSTNTKVSDSGFQSLVNSYVAYMPVGGSLRIYSQAYGYKSKITNTNSTLSALSITHIPETFVDTTLNTTTRDIIVSHFSSVLETTTLIIELDTDLVQYSPAEVLNAMHRYIVEYGDIFAFFSLEGNTVDSVKLIDGGFSVYSTQFKGRAKATLNSTNTPSLFITLPLFIEDLTGVSGNLILNRNSNDIDVHSALWNQSTASLTQETINLIAGNENFKKINRNVIKSSKVIPANETF